MSRIERTFAERRDKSQKALVIYLCVGDPSPDASVELALAAVEGGADVLELGVPFSDPTADGPAIAQASQRAIAAGASLRTTLEVAARVRARTDCPIVLFGYYNPVFVYGDVKLVAEARRSGIDALLVVDLPPEEGAELRAAARECAIDIIPLITPTSGPSRLESAFRGASGFVYYVSVAGITGGAKEQALAEAARAAAGVREKSQLPVVVGFGIDGPEKAQIAAGIRLVDGTLVPEPDRVGADGVVVGTAIVSAIHRGTSDEGRRRAVKDLVRSVRSGLDAP